MELINRLDHKYQKYCTFREDGEKTNLNILPSDPILYFTFYTF